MDGVEGHEQLGSGHVLVMGNGGGMSRGMRERLERRDVHEKRRADVAAERLGREIDGRLCSDAARMILCRPAISYVSNKMRLWRSNWMEKRRVFDQNWQ